MPSNSAHRGKKYVPQPVNFHPYRQNTDTEERYEKSITPPMSPRISSQTEQTSMIPLSKQTSKPISKLNATKWTRKKKIIVGLIVAAVILAIIILAILLGVLLSQKSNATTSNNQATSTTISAYWSFDATTADFYNIYNGTLFNGPSYFASSTTQPYVANGRGLSLSSSSSQYFAVSSPFLDLSSKSFTIELWIYPTISSSIDYGIFGQCQCPLCSNQCFHFIIRSYRLYASFTNNDLIGNATLSSNTWYHIAFVYNYDTKQQILYINGFQDAIKSNAAAYQGTNGTIFVGASQVFVTTSYYNGFLDNCRVTTQAKTPTEILNAATLSAYFSFDSPNPTLDNGPLGMNGTAVNTAIVSGRVNQAMRFGGSLSYFYVYGFYQTAYSIAAGRPFSISLWISPSFFGSCTIVQTAYQIAGTPCHNLLGLFATNGASNQIVVQGYAWPTIYGPFAALNTWTHVSVTYSFANGLQLYINGVYYGSTGSFTFSASSSIMYLQLGWASSCSSSSVVNAGYQGMIDELYMHNREITASEVSALANP